MVKKRVKKQKPVKYKIRSARIRPKHSHLFRSVLSLVILLVLVVAAGVAARHLLNEIEPQKHTVSVSATPKAKSITSTVKVPLYEVYPDKEAEASTQPPSHVKDKISLKDEQTLLARRSVPDPKPTRPTKKPTTSTLPKVAIIIDDIGYDPRMVDLFLSIDVPLTFSVLPFSPFQKKVAGRIQSKQHEIMLHLPMEPIEYPKVNPGPGALLASMDSKQLNDHLVRALEAVPGAVGVNNHMGSRLTTDGDRMYPILKALKKRGLYFIDSRTSYQSVSFELARSLQLPFAQRRIFLDNDTAQKKIAHQFNKLIQYAKKHGEAVGIGHPHEETFRVLSRELPRHIRQIQFVPASNIVHIPG